MDQVAQLTKPELIIVGGGLVLVFQVIWRVFHEAEALWTIPKWLVPLAIIPTAFGLAAYEHSIHPADPNVTKVLADAWVIQGAFLLGVMLTAWLTAVAAFSTPGPPGANGKPATSLVACILGAFLLWAFMISGAQPAMAQDAPTPLRWDPKRLTIGVSGFGSVHGFDVEGKPVGSSLDVDGFVNWNLSRHLNAWVGADREISPELTNLKVGGSGQLAGSEKLDRFHLFLGANFVRRSGPGADAFLYRDSWEGYVLGAWDLAVTSTSRRWLALVAKGSYDPNNNEPTAKLGLRIVPLGGEP